MLKQTLLVGSILAVTSTLAIANPAPYVGGSIGITNNSTNVTAHLPNGNARTLTIGSYRGVPFNVFAGYGGVISDNFYLAGELTGTVGTANISNNNMGLKTNYGLGASVIPGIKLSENSLLYGRVGVVRTHFSSDNENRNGGQLGLGLQTSLTQNIDIRTEYDFIAYKSIDAKVSGHKVASFAPRSDQFSVGLLYRFE